MSPLRLLFALLYLCCINCVVGIAFQQGSPSEAASTASIDPSELIRVRHQVATDSMKSVTERLDNLQTMPSCERIASAELMFSCASLNSSNVSSDDGIPRGIDHFLDIEKTIYAARLAICELHAADTSRIPSACHAFVPTSKSTKKSSFRGYMGQIAATLHQTFPAYEEITEASLKQCLTALQHCDPCWTSYSNSRQNAVHICQAVRAEREKDEEIELFKSLASASVDVFEGVAKSAERLKDTEMLIDELNASIRRFWQDFVSSAADEYQQMGQLWKEVELDIRISTHDIQEDFRQIQGKLKDTRHSLNELHDSQKETIENTSTQLSDLVVGQQARLGNLAYSTEQIDNKLAFLLEIVTQSLTLGIYNATESISTTNQLAARIIQQLSTAISDFSDAATLVGALKSDINETTRGLQALQVEQQHFRLDLQAKNNETMEMIDQTHVRMRTFMTALLYSMESSFNLVASFLSHFMGFTLLLFGISQCLAQGSILGRLAIAMSIGLSLAYISVVHGGPFDLLGHILEHHPYESTAVGVFEDEFDGPGTSQLAMAAIAGALVLGSIAVIICLLLKVRARQAQTRILLSDTNSQGAGPSGVERTNLEEMHLALRDSGCRMDVVEKGKLITSPRFNDPRYWKGMREREEGPSRGNKGGQLLSVR